MAVLWLLIIGVLGVIMTMAVMMIVMPRLIRASPAMDLAAA